MDDWPVAFGSGASIVASTSGTGLGNISGSAMTWNFPSGIGSTGGRDQTISLIPHRNNQLRLTGTFYKDSGAAGSGVQIRLIIDGVSTTVFDATATGETALDHTFVVGASDTTLVVQIRHRGITALVGYLDNLRLVDEGVPILTGPATITTQELNEVDGTLPLTVSYTPTTNTIGTLITVMFGNGLAAVPSVTVGGVAAEYMGNLTGLNKEIYIAVQANSNAGAFMFWANITGSAARDIVVSVTNNTSTLPIYVATADVIGLTSRSKRFYAHIPERPATSSAISVTNTIPVQNLNDAYIKIFNGDTDPSGTEVDTADVTFGAVLGATQIDNPLSAATAVVDSDTSRSFRTRFSRGGVQLSSLADTALRESSPPMDYVYPRTAGGTTGSVTISGTYDGTPAGVEARIVNWDTGAEVVAYTTLETSPSGGTFSGTVTVPVNTPCRTQLRVVGGTEVFESASRWHVGMRGAFYGQSNSAFMSLGPLSASDVVDGFADRSLRIRDGFLEIPLGAGEGNFAYNMETDSMSVMFAAGGESGRSLAELSKGNASGLYDDLLADLNAMGGNIEFLCWYQGEQDAVAGNATYAATLEQLRLDIETDLGQATGSLTFFVCTLAHAFGGGSFWSEINDEIREAATTYSNIILSHNNEDMDRIDDFHGTRAWYGLNGKRFARSIALENGDVTGSHQFFIASATNTSSSNTRVTVTHGIGTDFTPTTSIAGFEVSTDGSSYTSVTGARNSATTIDLDTSAIVGTVTNIRYLYGPNPTSVGAGGGAPTGIVIDNGDLSMPLRSVTSMAVT